MKASTVKSVILMVVSERIREEEQWLLDKVYNELITPMMRRLESNLMEALKNFPEDIEKMSKEKGLPRKE